MEALVKVESELKDLIEQLQNQIDEAKITIENRLKDAKEDQILFAIKKLNDRLDIIQARLPELSEP